MYLSRYLKTYSCARKGYSCMFSTLRASLALVPEDVVEAVRRGEDISADLEATLRDLGMVVDDLEEERQKAFRFLGELNREDRALQASVIVNLRCNFACTYCYEGKLKSHLEMGSVTAEQSIAYLKSRFHEGKEELILHFYGGEPLLSTDLIVRFAEELKPFAESRGASFKFTLVTNGSLMSRDTVNKLVPLGLTSAKVTIDGPRDNHNSSRPFKNGRGSYDTILRNLGSCADMIKITVGGNYTKDNYKIFPALLEHMACTGIGPKKIKSILFAPVQQVNDEFSTHEYLGGCASVNEPWITNATLYLRKAIIEQGFENPAVEPSPCMVDMNDAFVIHVDGTITKCPALIGHKKFVVGSVLTGITDFDSIFNTGSWRKEPACGCCEYLPLCYGGCRMMLFQRQGTVDGVDCKKPYLDSVLEELIKMELENQS